MKKFNLTTEQFLVYKKCLRDGMKFKDIAEKFNVSEKVIYSYHKDNLRRLLTQEEIEDLKSYIKEKTTFMSFSDISRRFNIWESTLHSYLKSWAEKTQSGELVIWIGKGMVTYHPQGIITTQHPVNFEEILKCKK